VSTATASAFPNPPWWVQLLNGAAAGLHRLGLPPFHLSSARLAALARQKTERHDLDPGPLEGLDRLLHFIDADRQLTFMGWRGLQTMVLNTLEYRRHFEQAVQAHPEILQAPLERPLFVVGLPRSGTTLLHMLLNMHPDCRWLRQWELEPPFPPPQHWGSARDRRQRQHTAAIEKYRDRFSQLDAMHPLDSPAECWSLLWLDFITHTFFIGFGYTGYFQWADALTDASVRNAYAHYRQQLQYLNWLQPGCHWVLKAPEHTVHLPALLATFPDARIIQLHRDPLRVTASTCNLAWFHQHYIADHHCESAALGPPTLALLTRWSQMNLTARQTLDADNFYDLHYRDLVKDPIEAVEGIYRRFDMPFPEAMGTRMQQWLAERHGAKRQKNRYRLEQFGLQPTDIEQSFADSRDYFNIPPEPPT